MVLDTINSFIASLSVAEAQSVIIPLTLFVIGMTIYAIFIFKFYRFLAKRDIITLGLKDHKSDRKGRKILRVVFYAFKHFVVFPAVVFFWFAFLSLMLILMSKSQPLGTTLLISISIVGAVRVTSYYSEDLSRDLAKMIPFALLGIFLVDTTFFSFDTFLKNIYLIPTMVNSMVYYMVFIVLLELVLRILLGLVGFVRGHIGSPGKEPDDAKNSSKEKTVKK